jgi:glycosyltransferase involved in cell wall biosynthesis
MKISAIICTRNRPDLIGRAVASVLANDHPDFELVIVDQSDTDATRLALDSFIAGCPNLNYLYTTRVGLSAAYNTGIARSKGETLAFTDDDCVAPRDWLRQIERAFAGEPDAHLVYGQVLIPVELRDTPGVVPDLKIAEPRRISRRYGFMIYGMGANFAARRALFDRIGGFDEVLGGGGPLRSSQDFDLQYRVYRGGLMTLLAPEVKVDHYGLRSSEDWPRTLTAYGIGDGGFYMKHARCGDLYAVWLLARKMANEAPRALVKSLMGRPSKKNYVLGVARGLRESFRFRIDRRRRIYVVRT